LVPVGPFDRAEELFGPGLDPRGSRDRISLAVLLEHSLPCRSHVEVILEGRGLARDESRIHLEDVTHVRSNLSDAPVPDRWPGRIADVSKLLREPM
jgi:hypothetical protein